MVRPAKEPAAKRIGELLRRLKKAYPDAKCSLDYTNALELLKRPNVDGALVGGASLEASTFLPIVAAAEEAATAQSE